jgi:probable F420-dependent oxidoreductase
MLASHLEEECPMPADARERRYLGFVPPIPAAGIAALAKQAEERGLFGLFAAQVWAPPWVPLAVAAGATERIQLASGIAIAAARSPFETAMTAIDLDRVSQGRFILGLGSSVLAVTRGFFGSPQDKPMAHLRETVAAVRHIIRGAHRGLAPFEGRWYSADFAGLQPGAPPLREEIPIWIAGLRGAAIRLGAEIADGVMGHPIWSVDWALERVQQDLKVGLQKGGKRREDVHVNFAFFVAVNPDPREAIEDARTTVAFYASAEEYAPFFEAHGFGDEVRRLHERARQGERVITAEFVPDEMVRTFALCGDPDEVRKQVERAWTVADSLWLAPPAWGLPMEKVAFYDQMIARTFYQ